MQKNLIFVFDRSGSMSGRKIEQAGNSLTYCLDRLNPDDRFAVLLFGTEVDDLSDGMQPASPEALAKAKKRVADVTARGGTAIGSALRHAIEVASRAEGLVMIVFLTDGKPTIGEVDVPRILKTVQAKNKSARIFAFGVGDSINTDLLDRLARQNRGTQSYVGESESIELKISDFYDKIATPVLSEVSVSVGGVQLRDMYPRRIGDLFGGSQQLVFGRFRGEGRQTVVVTGKVADRTAAFECEADFSATKKRTFIPALWAHRKVAFLLEEIRVNGKRRELVDEVVRLGRRYGIMTPYTSLLIVEDEEHAAAPVIRRQRAEFEHARFGARAVGWSCRLAASKSVAVESAGDEFSFGVDFSGPSASDSGGFFATQAVLPEFRKIAGTNILSGRCRRLY